MLQTTDRESWFVEMNRREVQREINSNKLVIDRDCFQKSPDERKALKELKADWKKKNGNRKMELLVKVSC